MTNFPDPFYRWRPHPWHGLKTGDIESGIINAFIEITPFDLVKYEVDKETGYLRVDRPQQSSSLPPSLYGFIPRTYCGKRIGELSDFTDQGDRDPLDICVMSERPISKSEVILTARVVGGIHMIDGGEADDKIIAVLNNDKFWADAQDINDLPQNIRERLRHYFATYKLVQGQEKTVTVEEVYNKKKALKVIKAATDDYEQAFGK